LTWFAVYRLDTGELVSLGTVFPDPLPEELACLDVGPLQPVGEWNTETRTYDPIVEKKPILTKLQFLQRFTAAERVAIRQAAKAVPALEDYMAMLDAAQHIEIDRPDTIAGVNALAAAGLLTEQRAAEILA
jgi:hypothetical protein